MHGNIRGFADPLVLLYGPAFILVFALLQQGLLAATPSCLLANSRIVNSLWNLFGATNQLVACLSLITVGVYILRYHDFDFRYILPFVPPLLWLGIFIFWALVQTIVLHLSLKTPIDWFTTVPTYPSIIIEFIVALFVIAIIFEVVYYFASGNHAHDAHVSKATGKILTQDEGRDQQELPAVGCC